MTMLEIKDLEVYYGMIQAIKGVSFEVNEGEIIALIGANGAGKTTILHTITGLLTPKKGTITFQGKELTKVPTYKIVVEDDQKKKSKKKENEKKESKKKVKTKKVKMKKIRNARVPAHKIVSMGMAHVPEGRRVFAHMTVYQNLKLGAFTRKNHKEFEETLAKIYQRFPRLEERRNQLAGTLSGGEQQMLAIGRALMSHPKLIVMDEPSMGLSPLLVEEVFKIIQEVNESGTTILLVEQNAKKALTIADRAYVLETGKIVLSGDADTLLHDEGIRKAYLGE